MRTAGLGKAWIEIKIDRKRIVDVDGGRIGDHRIAAAHRGAVGGQVPGDGDLACPGSLAAKRDKDGAKSGDWESNFPDHQSLHTCTCAAVAQI